MQILVKDLFITHTSQALVDVRNHESRLSNSHHYNVVDDPDHHLRELDHPGHHLENEKASLSTRCQVSLITGFSRSSCGNVCDDPRRYQVYGKFAASVRRKLSF